MSAVDQPVEMRGGLGDWLRERASHAVSEFTAATALVVLFIVLSFASPHFLTADNLFNIGSQTAVIAIIAAAQTMVIITKGIDLSVGSVAALAGVVGAMVVRDLGFSVWAATAVAIAVGAVAGLVNGLLVTAARIPPFIATLGTMSAGRGLVFIITGAVGVYGLPKSFQILGNGQLLGIPFAVVLTAVVAVGMAFLLSQTRFGQYTYAMGSNLEAARRSGIPVGRHLAAVYVLAGMLVGLGGMIAASRVNSGQPNYGISLELDVIAAAVIGGASLFGGQGRIVGTIIGAFLIALVRNGAVLLDISIHYQQVIVGVIIWAAVYFDQYRRRRLESRG
ncbi:monosaccharide ABC transporter membrane protein (CUT2 family) [Micromonospora pisi]|uniref:Monosaccharide ABC transporter membrane protein (CUT2 family) n=1 Tax=Micromonospora pisi TaxID=589240 RepID=A0A495JTG3_9ACTN|nr:ABC transporter permease [Micromonospora pisi]RKR91835.1 monosaccharide ABC transporter membrane protein (CUT2 family) [Micromonospora pisi]